MVLDGYIADGYGQKGHHCPADGEWYKSAKVGNNTWSFATAGGRSLGRLGETSPAKALEAFRALPPADRRPAVEAEPDPEKGILRLRPPQGGLVARAYGVALDRTEKGELSRAARLFTDCHSSSAGCVEPALTQVDMLWMTEAEARSLIPVDPTPGAELRVPELLVRRMLACTIPKCGPIGESGELTLVVTERSASTIVLRLEGFSRLGQPYEACKSAYAQRAPGEKGSKKHDGQVLRFLGFLRFDTEKRAFTAFDIVATGEAWGEYVNRAHGAGAGAEPRRWPVGFAFELAGKGAADRITPPAIVQNALYNGGLAERYWGK